jgi:hypothetical protein
MGDGQREPTLLEVAEKLDEVLLSYQRAAHGFLKLRLDSRKSVAKAAEGLAQIQRIDEELSGHVGQLVAAIARLRQGQEKTAEAVHRRALEVLERKSALESLLSRLEALAADVRSLGNLMPGDGRVAPDELGRIAQRVGELSDGALAFATEAQAVGFADLAAEGQALRQQLLAVKSRAARMERRTPPA